jgi:4-hydroxybenzoate polyprenyltransferase
MRPSHWIKNAFVLAPILFSRRYADGDAWAAILVAFGAFCLLSSAAYILNDLRDAPADRLHPTKRRRPIAAGRLRAPLAAATALVLALLGLGAAGGASALWRNAAGPLGGWALLVWAAAYLALTLGYTFWLKNHDVVDVLAVAMGFVFRAMAGAAAIAVPVSPWLFVCTFTLCLYIALTKRRGELLDLPPGTARLTRPAARLYDLRDIEHMISVSAAMAILTYCLYCVAPVTVKRFGSAHLVWTIPLVVYGLFRFNQLTRATPSDDPVRVLLRDRKMWLVLVSYVVLAAAIVSYGGHPSIRSVFESWL